MQKIIAICALICNNCPAFIATQKNDQEELTRIAELWSTDDEKLEKLWEHIQSPEAKETLERIRKLKDLTDAG